MLVVLGGFAFWLHELGGGILFWLFLGVSLLIAWALILDWYFLLSEFLSRNNTKNSKNEIEENE